jgi:hypothetical protein
MVSALVSLPVAGAVLLAYAALRTVVTRPRTVSPAPATPDLRDEPPAVVNLLVNRLVDAPQAASATLLDLAARGIVEIHQVADDPDHTLVRLRGTELPADRPAYEHRVVDRLARVVGDRMAPVTRLVERYADGGYRWQRRMVRAAVLDARRRGLIRRSGGGLVPALAAAGLAAAAVLAPLVPRPETEGFVASAFLLGLGWIVLALTGGIILSAISTGGRPAQPDRYTARGRDVTAHWLGVAAWLRAHDTLRDLPPAAVAVWDRYLAYGVALDTFPHAARVLDLETVGQREVLRSHHTGQWRTVHVRHDRRRRLLRPAGPVAAQASLIWAALTLPFWLVAGVAVATTVTRPYARWLVLAVVAVQAGRAGYRLVRSLLDLVRPVRVTGTVLDISIAGQQPSADAAEAGLEVPDLVTHYFVVVDDGSSDVLRPWIVNRDIARDGDGDGARDGTAPRPRRPDSDRLDRTDPAALAAWHERLVRPGFQPGDRVTLVGQRWSRFVTALERLPDSAQPATRLFTERGA